ncbi:MAG: hypothetical protein OXE76_12820 [Alphaproteobacteria bacterium]|nr:hypothetical protein [Alphaproteobacteria bacterium]
MLQSKEVSREAREVRDVDEEPADDQDGLIVRLRRIGQRSEIPRLVDEADFHPSPKMAMATMMVAIGSAAHDGEFRGSGDILWKICTEMSIL